MPNWCENIVIVEGEEKEIDKFLEVAMTKNKYAEEEEKRRNLPLDFDKIIPYPEEQKYRDKLIYLKEMIKQCKNEKELTELRQKEKITDEMMKEMMLLSLEDDDKQGWYDWNTSHWGTKWNANFIGHEDDVRRVDDNTVVFRFDTAWGPSLPVSLAITKTFKLITTHLYYEGGMGFSGILRCQENNVIFDKHNSNATRNWDYPKTLFKKWKLEKIYKE